VTPDDLTGRVLVVDDVETNRDLLARRLQRRGFEVHTAEDGAAALGLLSAGEYDLVLLDIMMPGLDGFEVLRRIRARSTATQLPVIMATAKDDREDIVRALELGANDYVTKPLDFPVVLARTRTQLALKRSVDEILALKRDLKRRHDELHDANTRMKRDLTAAARVQAALLPSEAPDAPGVAFAWTYRPCDELAGDSLNAFRLTDRHVGLYVLDVSGHGVAAALLSVTLTRILQPIAGQSSLVRRRVGGPTDFEPTPPAAVADELNRRFQLDTELEQYFTILYGVLEIETGELRYASAGHPGPIHAPRSGEPADLSGGSFPIGWVERGYEERRLRLARGDRLYVYTDGIPEAMSPQREPFGVERVLACLQAGRAASLADGLDGLVRAAAAWRAGPLDDDVSVLALEIEP